MEQYAERSQVWLELFGPIKVKALVTLVVGRVVARILTGITHRIMHKAKVKSTLIGFVANLTFALLMIMAVTSKVARRSCHLEKST